MNQLGVNTKSLHAVGKRGTGCLDGTVWGGATRYNKSKKKMILKMVSMEFIPLHC